MTSKIYPHQQHPRYKVVAASSSFEDVISTNDTIKQSETNLIPSSSISKIPQWSTVFWIGLGTLIFISLAMVVVIPIAALANTGNAVSNSTVATISTICPTTAITTTITSSVLPEECINYTTITDPTRSPDYSATSSCDTSVFTSTPVWVRFTGSGGTLLPSCPLDANQCGTLLPGWYSGIYPSTAGTVTSGFVCYTYSGDFCYGTNFILITNCNGFYVYYLREPPYCDSRYCTI